MRFLIVGFLVLAMPVVALAQARGQVLSVGFNNHYRPDCWTPMLVQLTSQSPDSQTYQIQIVQEDLNRDRVTYTQVVTLGGNIDGKAATTENYWVFFKPKPTDGGLPDATDLTTTLNTLNSQLKVFLCDKDGKQLSTLPLTMTILNVDPVRPPGDTSRSRKLILFVTDGMDKPEIADDSQQKGILQDVDAVTVSPRDLPSNVIGYEGVDAIVWMDADANFLVSGTHTPSLEAILQWVHQGGNLVVCQPPEAFKIKPFEEILPVGSEVNGEWTIPTVDRTDMEPLEQIAHPTLAAGPAWPGKMGTFKVGRVEALAGAKVDQWMNWDMGGKAAFTPWLARRGVGLGAVTWVAQDLGNAELTRQAHSGWRYVWDRVFDWNNPASVPEDYKAQEGLEDFWPGEEGLDLGKPLLSGLELTHTAASLISIACVSFVLYWIVAGPGIYFVLMARKQTHLSWFFFGLTAVAATGLTALLVKAVVRGSPKLHHMSVVRYAAGEPDGVIDSRFGLYIPQDGIEKIGLGDTAAHEVSYLTPFSQHPQYADNSEDEGAYLEYQIPVRDDSESDGVSVSIPYRSSSKDFQAHWVGEIKGTIDVADAVKLDAGNKLSGTLVNHTGNDLYHVFLAFKQPMIVNSGETSARDKDIIIYVSRWAKDDSLKLDDLMANKNLIDLDDLLKTQPMGSDVTYGEMGGFQKFSDAWSTFWHGKEDAVAGNLDYVLPMLTLFDRLPPWASIQQTNRFELYRRGARDLDLSAALSAGGLVICGREMENNDTGRSDLPVPLTVGDVPVNGDGTTIYQFVLPLDRSAVKGEPSTRP